MQRPSAVLAGRSYGTPEGLQRALAEGAAGVQLGTAFAFSRESGLDPALKRAILAQAAEGDVQVHPDWRASPTGFPFRIVQVEGTLSDETIYEDRRRVCDLGVLWVPCKTDNGSIGYRCPAEPTRAEKLRLQLRFRRLLDHENQCHAAVHRTAISSVRRPGRRGYLVIRMRFDVLGPFLVEDDDEPIRLGGRLQQAVLAFLLASPVKTASVDAIVLELWPDQLSEDVRDSLYVYVSQLRKAVGGDRIVRVEGGYRFEPEENDVIAAVSFEDLFRSARRLIDSDPREAVDLLDDALAKWRGRAYEGFEDIPSLALEAQRLDGLRLEALESQVEANLAIAEDPNIADLTRLCEDHPYRERLWGLLARSLYRAGRQAESIRALSRLRSALGDELGIEPAPETIRLEEQILLHDPALAAAASPRWRISSDVRRDR